MTDMGVAQPGTGRLRLTMRKSALTWGALLTPQVRVNGQPIGARWGENVYDLWAGPNTVEVSCQYLWTFGRAAAQVAVAEGQEQQLFYAMPVFTFLPGRMGTVPQRLPGAVALWTVVGILGAGMLLAVATLVGGMVLVGSSG